MDETHSEKKNGWFVLPPNAGKHGEDVKALLLSRQYAYGSYMKDLYKKIHSRHSLLRPDRNNRGRSREEFEYGMQRYRGYSDKDRSFDVFVEYAKVKRKDILIQISGTTQSDDGGVHLLLPLVSTNTW